MYGFPGDFSAAPDSLLAGNIVNKLGGRTVLLRPNFDQGRQTISRNSYLNSEGTCLENSATMTNVLSLIEEADLSALYPAPLVVR
jgi:calcineurin-like phosphoesterase family protein